MVKSKDWFQGLEVAYSNAGKDLQRRFFVFLSVAIVGMAISWAAFSFVRNTAASEYRLQFEKQADLVAAELQTNFNLSLEHLLAISRFFAASTEVTRQDFKRFVSPVHARHESLYATAFLPRVPATDLESFEAAARAEGLRDFGIHAVDRDGSKIPRKPQANYYPIFFEEPDIPEVLGIDCVSHPEQGRYVELACAAVNPVATPPLSLIEDPEDMLSVMVYVPIRFSDTAADHDCDGLAVVVLRVRPIIENAIGQERLDEVQLVLTDPGADHTSRLVHKNFPGNALSIERPEWPVAKREVNFADRTWSLTLSPATGSRFAPLPAPIWILGIGTLLSLLAAYSLSATIAIGGLRKQVDNALQLGQYQLNEKIGEGGMGEVYRAQHAMLIRPTAVKLLKAGQSSRIALARFEREVQLMSQLSHPNTIQVYDYGCADSGVFYYAMEYLDGVNLAELIKSDGPLPPGRVVQILLQVCGSLAEAHASGLIHRDIKPANIMVTCRGGVSDFVKVLDFGLAKETDSDSSPVVTAANAIAGTPLYMSPEATQGANELDQRSDIYSLGVVAYEMLTGHPPFQGDSPFEVCMQHATKQPRTVSEITGSDFPKRLEKLTMRCLEKSPSERPQSIIEVREQLMQLSNHLEGWSDRDAEDWWKERSTSTDLTRDRLASLESKQDPTAEHVRAGN